MPCPGRFLRSAPDGGWPTPQKRRWLKITALTTPTISGWPATSRRAVRGSHSCPRIEQNGSGPRLDRPSEPASATVPVLTLRTNAGCAPIHAYRWDRPPVVPGSCRPRPAERKILAHVFLQLHLSDVATSGQRSLVQ